MTCSVIIDGLQKFTHNL